jgi:hypothetical protein
MQDSSWVIKILNPNICNGLAIKNPFHPLFKEEIRIPSPILKVKIFKLFLT